MAVPVVAIPVVAVPVVIAAGSGAGGIACLRHEAVDDAVEHHPVIEPLARQLLDPRHVIGRKVGTKLDDDAAGFELRVKSDG